MLICFYFKYYKVFKTIEYCEYKFVSFNLI